MNILFHTPLDESIVDILLADGESEAEELWAKICAHDGAITIQAIYKRLRILLASGVVIKNEGFYSINNEWREETIVRLGQSSSLPQLKNGESIRYAFKSLASLDAFWKHLMLPLEKDFSNFPIFFYNPYEIWIELSDRAESEKRYLDKFSKDRRYGFYLLGKNVEINTNFKQKFQSEYLQISVGSKNFSPSDYITVIADYIITTRLSPSMTKTIESLYEANSPKNCASLDSIFVKKTALKLFVELNHIKACALRKKIGKDFHIPKEVKEKFNIFS